MTPAEILRKARDLISVPERWTKGELARSAGGYKVSPRSSNATCWCIEGALIKASGEWAYETRAIKLMMQIVNSVLHGWNDAPKRTHAEVLGAFDHAIALAEQP